MAKVSAVASAHSRQLIAQRRAGTRLHEMLRHKRRCSALPPPSEAELEAMVAAFRARGGEVTACPDAYALPIQNGAGRDAGRWSL